MSLWCITGMPGVGKTHLALALAAALHARGERAHVLHTDVLKETLRTLHIPRFEGPGHLGDVAGKCQRLRSILMAHAGRAHRGGYTLIIEGTLALAFTSPKLRVVCLEGSESVPEDLRTYRAELDAFRQRSRDLEVLDASLPLETLVGQLLS